MLPSPVPTQSVFELGSFGSIEIVPAALIPKLPPRYFQFGFGASALFVRQTPPPAGVIHIRHFAPWRPCAGVRPQFGSMARSVVRPAAAYS